METTTQRENAYELNINEDDGTVTLIVKKGIIGALGNQLRATSKRKGSTILKRMGYDLKKAGDILYGQDEK